ncbi:MGDG synthase family glycosyltransferase [Actinopolymorpha alba]|uniref:MGDG synthase family glycosyltransferase n=1 Tax=Actinopolymorpha alba TaxID=533267 RepID=UPI00035E19A0|nr:hypothetical protein [Actinopolymorpha alba]
MTGRQSPHDSGRRYLIISASMGGGHDAVAAEVARRLESRGHRTQRIDVLDLLPAALGSAVRTSYGLMLRHAPGRYQRIYDRFGDPDAARRLVEPLVRLATSTARATVDELAPDVVISTFHLAAAVAGRLREDGAIRGRSVVVLTEFVPHAVWLSPGNDAYFCLSPAARGIAATLVGDRALWLGPLVRPGPPSPVPGTPALAPAAGLPVVLVSAGSWGIGTHLAETIRALIATRRYFPLALCGHNEQLAARIRAVAGPDYAVGWRPDLAASLAGAYALVENSGGQTCTEAFAVGTPVVIHAPLPGHGRAAAEHLERAGAVRRSDRPEELIAALDELHLEADARALQTGRARAVFRPDSTDLLVRVTESRSGAAPR